MGSAHALFGIEGPARTFVILNTPGSDVVQFWPVIAAHEGVKRVEHEAEGWTAC